MTTYEQTSAQQGHTKLAKMKPAPPNNSIAPGKWFIRKHQSAPRKTDVAHRALDFDITKFKSIDHLLSNLIKIIKAHGDPEVYLKYLKFPPVNVHQDLPRDGLNYLPARLFMPLDQLTQSPQQFASKPHHAIERYFYILLWICLTCSGPDGAERSSCDITLTSVHFWYLGKSNAWCGALKGEAMYTTGSFEEDVLTHCDPYFECLKPLFRNLRMLLFDRSDPLRLDVTHKKVIKLMRSVPRSCG